MNSRIIFLNGCGSSGKTSIARSIQYLSDELWLTFGIDTFIDIIPRQKDHKETDYFNFIYGSNERGITCSVETGLKGKQLFNVMPDFAKLLADAGHNIIIDEVLFDDESLQSYIGKLADHTIYYIGVLCDLKIMQEREILRGDRTIGLSNDQIDRVHNGKRTHYDLKIDTSNISPFEAATQILDYIRKEPRPNISNNEFG